MKLLIILLINIITLYLYNDIFDNGALGLIVVVFSFIIIKPNFKEDKRFKEFIDILLTVEVNNLEDAINEFKEEKKITKNVFTKENMSVIQEFQKLKYTKTNLQRFCEIQNLKNQFIEIQVKKRLTAFYTSCLANLLMFLPLMIVKFRNPFFFYQLYNGGYYIVFVLSLILIVANNLVLIFSNRKNKDDILFYNNYSLCFHKNCLSILSIEDSHLTFDSKGNATNVEYKPIEKNYSNIIYMPFISSLIAGFIIYSL